MMRANLKPAIISAVVVAILAGLLLGIRLNQQGTTLSLVGAGPDVYWKIGAAAAFLHLHARLPADAALLRAVYSCLCQQHAFRITRQARI